MAQVKVEATPKNPWPTPKDTLGSGALLPPPPPRNFGTGVREISHGWRAYPSPFAETINHVRDKIRRKQEPGCSVKGGTGRGGVDVATVLRRSDQQAERALRGKGIRTGMTTTLRHRARTAHSPTDEAPPGQTRPPTHPAGQAPKPCPGQKGDYTLLHAGRQVRIGPVAILDLRTARW